MPSENRLNSGWPPRSQRKFRNRVWSCSSCPAGSAYCEAPTNGLRGNLGCFFLPDVRLSRVVVLWPRACQTAIQELPAKNSAGKITKVTPAPLRQPFAGKQIVDRCLADSSWEMTRLSSWHSGHRQIARWDMSWLPTSTVPGCYERSGDGLGGLSPQWSLRNRNSLLFQADGKVSRIAAKIVKVALRQARYS